MGGSVDGPSRMSGEVFECKNERGYDFGQRRSATHILGRGQMSWLIAETGEATLPRQQEAKIHIIANNSMEYPILTKVSFQSQSQVGHESQCLTARDSQVLTLTSIQG